LLLASPLCKKIEEPKMLVKAVASSAKCDLAHSGLHFLFLNIQKILLVLVWFWISWIKLSVFNKWRHNFLIVTILCNIRSYQKDIWGIPQDICSTFPWRWLWWRGASIIWSYFCCKSACWELFIIPESSYQVGLHEFC
jgi:hypothetical protein